LRTASPSDFGVLTVERLPEAERTVADGDFRGDREPTAFHLDQKFAPALRAFPHADLSHSVITQFPA
jgi:hypothetical protein